MVAVSASAPTLQLQTLNSESLSPNIGALNNYPYYVFRGVPYYTYSIMGPETLFYLLRPLYHRSLGAILGSGHRKT